MVSPIALHNHSRHAEYAFANAIYLPICCLSYPRAGAVECFPLRLTVENRAWWHMPVIVIPALGRLRQEDLEFKASLGYTVQLSQNTKLNQPNPTI
jgi:hypothetical protein